MDREGAAFDREAAVGRREGGARDRTRAADDREAASADRVTSAKDREASSIDELTGAHRRGAGLLELERDITRAKRTNQSFVLAFVDVDGLKVTNDALGHAAGDQVLCQVVDVLRRHLRSYDLIIRFGGDEFVCSLMDLTIAEAAKRFLLIDTDLADSHHVSVTAGLAELQSDDSVDDLIARADEALYRERGQHPSTRS
jgi:diguanylate cyclase (GGDEF)-like protein